MGKDDLARRAIYKVWEGSGGRTGLSLKAEEGGQGGQWVKQWNGGLDGASLSTVPAGLELRGF